MLKGSDQVHHDICAAHGHNHRSRYLKFDRHKLA